jgi:hypothetical protein
VWICETPFGEIHETRKLYRAAHRGRRDAARHARARPARPGAAGARAGPRDPGRSAVSGRRIRSQTTFAGSWCTNDRVEDRRTSPRHEAYVSAWLEASQGRSTIAITRDISSAGLLILTRIPLEVGEEVTLTAALGDAQHMLSGTVVRQEDLEPHELWRYKAALAVDEADPALARFHAALAGHAKSE